MKKTIILFAVFCGLSGLVLAQSFTDLNNKTYWGKTNIKRLTAALDANFTQIESGTVDGSFDSLSFANDLTGNLATNEEVTITSTNGTTAGYVMRILDNTANPNTTTILRLDATADGDADLEFLECRDNASADSMFKVDAAGNTTIAGTLGVTGAATVGSLSTGTGEATVDGKYAVVGPDATTGQMVLAATITSTAAGPQTNSFVTAFGAAPIVTCTYTEDPGDVQPLYVTNITTTNFVCTVTADKNFNYIAIGQRP